MHKELEDLDEKGILVAEFHEPNNITISLMNKDACKITKWEGKSAIGLRIEELMPEMIAEHHA